MHSSPLESCKHEAAGLETTWHGQFSLWWLKGNFQFQAGNIESLCICRVKCWEWIYLPRFWLCCEVFSSLESNSTVKQKASALLTPRSTRCSKTGSFVLEASRMNVVLDRTWISISRVYPTLRKPQYLFQREGWKSFPWEVKDTSTQHRNSPWQEHTAQAGSHRHSVTGGFSFQGEDGDLCLLSSSFKAGWRQPQC